MTDRVFLDDRLQDMFAGIVELHAATLSTVVGSNIEHGLWTKDDALARLEGMLERSRSDLARSVYTGVLKAFEAGESPFLTVIEGGKADD